MSALIAGVSARNCDQPRRDPAIGLATATARAKAATAWRRRRWRLMLACLRLAGDNDAVGFGRVKNTTRSSCYGGATHTLNGAGQPLGRAYVTHAAHDHSLALTLGLALPRCHALALTRPP